MKLEVVVSGAAPSFMTSPMVTKFVRTLFRICRRAPRLCRLSFSFVSMAHIRSLNRQYRQCDQATDVLSFGYSNNGQLVEGDIVICPDYVRKQAATRPTAFASEVWVMVVHGCLHVLGFDHQRRGDAQIMQQYQNRLLRQLVPVVQTQWYALEY